MKTVAELKQERASKIEAQRTMLDTLKTENRDFNETEQTRFDILDTEIGTLDTQIERAQKMENAAKRAAALKIDEPVKGAQQRGADDAKKQFSVARAILSAINKQSFTDEERSVINKGAQEMRESGIKVMSNAITLPADAMREYSVTGNSGAKGGALVPTQVMPVDPMLASLKLAELGVDIITGAVGKISFPSSEGLTFGYYGENESVTGTDSEFDGPEAEPHRLAGVIEISNQLLLQSNADAYVMKLIYQAIDAATLVGALNGDDVKAPKGAYSAITTNDLSGTPGAITHKDLVALKSAIKSANATEKSLGYLFDHEVEGALELTKKDAGSGNFLLENDKVIGRRYNASTLVPTLDTGASHPVIFGDWSQMKFVQWSGVQIVVDPYTKADAGKTRLIVNTYVDTLIVNEKAFAIKKDVTIS